jgi:hypothetical protein
MSPTFYVRRPCVFRAHLLVFDVLHAWFHKSAPGKKRDPPLKYLPMRRSVFKPKHEIMTEGEAQAFCRRLEIIWGVQTYNYNAGSIFCWLGVNGMVVNWALPKKPAIRWYAKAFCVSFASESGVYTNDPDEGHEQEMKDFLPIFRRNCWLSGCDVECSAQEQAEWTSWFQERTTTAA